MSPIAILVLEAPDKKGKPTNSERWFEVHDVTDEDFAGFWLDSRESAVLDQQEVKMTTESKYRLYEAI